MEVPHPEKWLHYRRLVPWTGNLQISDESERETERETYRQREREWQRLREGERDEGRERLRDQGRERERESKRGDSPCSKVMGTTFNALCDSSTCTSVVEYNKGCVWSALCVRGKMHVHFTCMSVCVFFCCSSSLCWSARSATKPASSLIPSPSSPCPCRWRAPST